MRISLARCGLSLVLLAGLCSAHADTITSSASSMASQSSASLSDSISGSSNSSSGDKVAAGPYTVTHVAAAPDGRVRLQLAPAAGQPEALVLTLPQPIAVAQALAPGVAVHLLARPYGLAVAPAADAEPYFLAIDDRLRRDLDSVKL